MNGRAANPKQSPLGFLHTGAKEKFMFSHAQVGGRPGRDGVDFEPQHGNWCPTVTRKGYVETLKYAMAIGDGQVSTCHESNDDHCVKDIAAASCDGLYFLD